MADQLYIGDDGHIKAQPLTWDGEPLYSPETISESPQLFSAEAFKQMRGQTSLDALKAEAWDGPGGFWENRERNS